MQRDANAVQSGSCCRCLAVAELPFAVVGIEVDGLACGDGGPGCAACCSRTRTLDNARCGDGKICHDRGSLYRVWFAIQLPCL